MRLDDERVDVIARLELIEIGEVILDVFFRREIRAPRRLAAGAVCECAEGALTRRVVFGSHQRRAPRRTTDIDGRVRGDAAVETRVFYEAPATAFAFDLDD